MLPSATHVGILWDSSMDRTPLTGMDSAARTLGMQVHLIEVREASELETAFKRAADHQPAHRQGAWACDPAVGTSPR